MKNDTSRQWAAQKFWQTARGTKDANVNVWVSKSFVFPSVVMSYLKILVRNKALQFDMKISYR